MRFFHPDNFFGSTDRNDLPPRVASLRSEVDDVVGRLDDVQIVLDHQDRVPGIPQPMQHI